MTQKLTNRGSLRCLLAVALVAGLPAVAAACTIPVFRYALERWELTPYEFVVFHDGPLIDPVEKALKAIEVSTTKANATVTRVDLSKPIPPKLEKLWQQEKQPKAPWLIVRSSAPDVFLPAWSGLLSEKALTEILDSPARQALVKHLSRGMSGVFVLLPSGKKDEDDAAAKLLEAELPRLQKLVRIPDQDPNGPQLRTGLPLKVEFTTMTIDRANPAEAAFVRMLLNTEDDLPKVNGPIVLPVFGRGRLLCSLFAEDLTKEQLGNVVRFLCGECSCQVKELNPGVDLLLTADWADLLEKAGPAPTGILAVETKALSPMSAEPAPPPIEPSQTPAVPTVTPQVAQTQVSDPAKAPTRSTNTAAESVASDDGRLTKWWLALGGAGVLVLLTGVWVLRSSM